mmetsp:Transcript_14696/g.31758  ORF Transcript_14696/g.31758 Transcript_14696/m.31758 type:complete len:332 (+) Transcript_14696:203-1198(+)
MLPSDLVDRPPEDQSEVDRPPEDQIEELDGPVAGPPTVGELLGSYATPDDIIFEDEEQPTGELGKPLGEHGWIDVIHHDEIDSTQAFVERQHTTFNQAKLTVVTADFQTAGRGTRDRVWTAGKSKSILMTFFFRFPLYQPTHFVNRNAPNVTKVLSLAIVETLKWASGNPRDVNFNMKWPNDVVANDHKIAGVLARALLNKGRLDGVVIGTGVNLNQLQEEMDAINRPVWPATSLKAITKREEEFDIPAVRNHLIQSFAAELKLFFHEGFPAFRDRVNAHEVFLGKPVRFRVSEYEEYDGVFQGVDQDGNITLRLRNGAMKTFPSGEIIPK